MSTLSLLSRGNAQMVKTSQEKLVVYYEPEDYFNWKSRQDFYIRRFLSGRYSTNDYWAVPTHKTYSTRKGALVLFSEDLALSAWNVSQDKRVKKRLRYKRKNYQIELSTLQDLTGAILSYGRKKDHTEPHWQPYLHILNEEDVQRARQIRPGYSPKRYLTRLFRTWDPNTIYKLQQSGCLRDSAQLQQLTAVGDSSGRHPDLSSTPLKYHRLPVCTFLPYWSNTDVFTNPGHCTPVEEETGNEEELANNTENLEIYGKNSSIPSAATLRKFSPERRDSRIAQSSRKVKEHSPMGEARQNQSCGDDTMSNVTDRQEKLQPVDMCFFKENYAPPHGKPHTTFYGGHFAGRKKQPHSNQQKDYTDHLPEGGFLPPIPQSHGQESQNLKDTNTKVLDPLKLPPITEDASRIPQRKRRRQATTPPKELLVIPLLVCFENPKINQEDQMRMDVNPKNEIVDSTYNEESAGGKSKNEKGFNEEHVDPLPTIEIPTAVAENRFKTLQMDIDWNLDPNSGGDLEVPEASQLGSLPPINGKKGPGNQTSKSNLKASNAGNNASAINAKGLPTGIIRGSLPEELKECCKGSSVGSLIMGPDGEIVCLSLMGATRDTDISIRFDFIPEEEEEDCLPVESAGQEEQWPVGQLDSETEQENYKSSSLQNSENSSERVATPPHRKGKKGKRKNSISESSLQGESGEKGKIKNSIMESSFQGESDEEDGQHRFAEKDHKGYKGDVRSIQKKKKLTELKSDGIEQDLEERNSRTGSPEQEGKHYSAEFIPENYDETSSTSTNDFQDQKSEEETSDQDKSEIDDDKTDQRITSLHDTDKEMKNTHDTDQRIKNEPETDQNIKEESHQSSTDGTDIRPKPIEAKSHQERRASSGQETIRLQEGRDINPPAPSTGQNQDNSKSVQGGKGSEKRPNQKPKNSEITTTQNPKLRGKNENNPEIVKDVEKESIKRKQKVPAIPQETEVSQDDSLLEKQQLSEEEETALLQEITNTETKDATKRKGKKKAKSEKAPKAEKDQTSPAKKVNKKTGAEQGKAVFVVGQPKNKKGESKISAPKKPSEKAKVEETIHETQESPEEIQEEEEIDTEKESEDSYVVIEYHERSPTPTQSSDIQSEPDAGVTPQTSDQTSEQAADKQGTATLEVTGQANEEEHAYSETSEVTSSSVRQRRSSRAREISEKADRRRLEVERKRREREEQLRLEKEQEERMEKMKEELEEEQARRAEEMRLRKQQEEKEKQQQEQQRACKMQLEQQALERARQQQEEHRRKMQEIQKRKQHEELERIELERQRQKEQERLESEERLRLLEMEAEEREEYYRKKREREEQARREAEERRLKAEEEAKALMEEAQRQAHLLAKQTAALEQQLQFNRGLMKESVGMDQTQGISRPWVFSYFEFLELLGLPLPVEGE
ncbi:uncharacterized protein KIAA2012 homolog isoform X2 [Ranitomeya variabilis]|uniref:uncharacterized protein KIAA2012 homolog isoform X2 n=1 Tax=Ranitomeya variabilis TaxID=490064 RepID=UPI00405670BB